MGERKVLNSRCKRGNSFLQSDLRDYLLRSCARPLQTNLYFLVMSKYYPPDFDPAKLPKLKVPKDRQYVVRLMAPFTMRCLTCGNYVYKGKKFNARKETALGEVYLGIQIYRFYIRCPKCLQEITFKTDPENTDYSVENGAYRTFQAERLSELEEERLREEREEEEANNPMLALENRTAESRREMDVLDALEEIRDWNARNAQVKLEDLLERHVEVEQAEREGVERRELEEARRVLQEKREGLRRLEDSTEESVAMPEPKRPKIGQEHKVRPSSKQKLMGLVKRKDQQLCCKDPQLEPRLSTTATESDTSQGQLVGSTEVREQAGGGSVAREASQKFPTASSTMAGASHPLSQGPSKTPATAESGLGGAAVRGSLGLLGTYSDSEDSE